MVTVIDPECRVGIGRPIGHCIFGQAFSASPSAADVVVAAVGCDDGVGCGCCDCYDVGTGNDSAVGGSHFWPLRFGSSSLL